MKILVIGGTGTVGSHVVKALLAKKYDVRVLTRSIDNAAKLPSGAHPAIGSMEDPKALSRAFEGVDAVWLSTPLTQNETQQGLAAVGTARAHGVRKLVYMSAYNVERGVRIPHFASKVPIQNAIRESRLDWTLLQPNCFFQNDLWIREIITQYGVYPLPIGSIGVSAVDVRDIADAAVHALVDPGHSGKEYPLIGPDVLTGEKVADTYSRHLGKDVKYIGNDLDEWERSSKGQFPDWLLRDLKVMYAHIQKYGFVATPHDLGIQAKVLGHSPRRFGDFVSEIAPSLRAMEKSA